MMTGSCLDLLRAPALVTGTLPITLAPYVLGMPIILRMHLTCSASNLRRSVGCGQVVPSA
eukprot:3588890-Alexandrium_andersonii.AAC.1